MDTIAILKYIIVFLSIGLIVSVALQSRSGGLGTMFGGASGGEAFRSKRGIEAVLFNATIVFGVLLVIASLAVALMGV